MLLLALALACGSATADVVAAVIPTLDGFPFCILQTGAWLSDL
jgi:hypothetical protein